MGDAPKSPSRDDLIKTTNENKIELTEEELKRVSGGTTTNYSDGFQKWIEL